MGGHIFDDYANKYSWLRVQEYTIDLYNYSKFIGVIAATALAVINTLAACFTKSIRIKKLPQYYIPAAIFAAFVILSFVFSEYKSIAFWGWRDLYEGTAAWLCYIFMFLYTINFVQSERDIKIVVFFVLAFTAFINVLGLLQMCGIDFLRADITKKILMPPMLREHLSITAPPYVSSQTLYNPNYVSFYLSMLIPFVGMLFLRRNSNAAKATLGILFGLFVLNIIGSYSMSGWVGVLFAMSAVLVWLNRALLQWWKSIAVLTLVLIIGAGISVRYVRYSSPDTLNPPESVNGDNTAGGAYAFDSAKIYRKLNNDSGYTMYAGAGIFLGVCAFIVSALVNDSSLSVMPLFFGLLGIGIACNHLCHKQG